MMLDPETNSKPEQELTNKVTLVITKNSEMIRFARAESTPQLLQINHAGFPKSLPPIFVSDFDAFAV